MSRASDHHFPCPCGAELADECPKCAQSHPFGSMRLSQRTVQLSDLYDADKRTRDPLIARLAAESTIPHPLYEVRYADGVLRDTTAGRVRSQGRRA